MNLNRCRCGNRPDYVTQLNGLVRISCVLAKCNEIVCARPGMAQRAWNEINPLVDEEQTKPHNPVPTHRPHVAAEPLETLRRGLAIVEPINSTHWRYVGENTFETVEPLSERAAADLEQGIQSAKAGPLIDRGSFAQFADDDEIPVTVEAPVSADELPTDPTGGGV